MITLGLAWINAKYKYDYEFIFIGTIVLDVVIIESIVKLIK